MASIRKRKWRNYGQDLVGWVVDYTDAHGKRERKQFSSRREADAFRIEVETKLRNGTFRGDATKVTVEQTADLFLEHCRARMKRKERMTRRTYDGYEGHIRNYICPDTSRHVGCVFPFRLRSFTEGISKVKLAQLSARRISDFRDDLRNAGVSVPTTRKILGTLKVLLSYAISRDLVANNAAIGIAVIGRRDEGSKKILPPSKEAMRGIMEVADENFRIKLAFASSTGVRAGEFHALRWKHIDFERAEVKIETRVDSYHEEDFTKTTAGMRTIPISLALVVILKAWKLKTKWSKPSDLVFPNLLGEYVIHDNMIKRKFTPLFGQLALKHVEDPEKFPLVPTPFNWHALRHFAISTWIEAGLSPKAIQTFAGHSTLQVTMDRYGHLFKSEDHHKAMDQISRDMFG